MSKEVTSPTLKHLDKRLETVTQSVEMLKGFKMVIGTKAGPEKFDPGRTDDLEDKLTRILRNREIVTKIEDVTIPYLERVVALTTISRKEFKNYMQDLNPGRAISTEDLESIYYCYQLERKGISISDLSKMLGVNLSTAYRIFQDHGSLERNKGRLDAILANND